MAAPAYVSVAHGAAGSVTLGTTAANDILIFFGQRSVTTSSPTPGGTYSGGAWTKIGDRTCIFAASQLMAWWSRATGNSSGQTVTTTSGAGVSVVRVSGCLTSATPVDANTNVNSFDSGFNPNMTAFNTTVVDTLVVWILTQEAGDNWSAQTAGGNAMTERFDANNATNFNGWADRAQAASGTTGAFASSQASHSWGVMGFALKPLPATARGVPARRPRAAIGPSPSSAAYR